MTMIITAAAAVLDGGCVCEAVGIKSIHASVTLNNDGLQAPPSTGNKAAATAKRSSSFFSSSSAAAVDLVEEGSLRPLSFDLHEK